MSELSAGGYPNQLSTDQVNTIQGQLYLLLSPKDKVAPTVAEGRLLADQVTDDLAEALTDGAIGNQVGIVLAETMLKAVKTRPDPDAGTEMYAVWGIIKRAKRNNPDASISGVLLREVRDRAHTVGDNKIAAEAAIELECMADDAQQDSSSNVINHFESAMDLDPSEIDLDQICDRREEVLSDLVNNTELVLKDPGYAFEEMNLAFRRDYSSIKQDLDEGKYRSEAGIAAAEAVHDENRLAARWRAEDLFEDIQAGLYLTGAGTEAAKARQDCARLSAHGLSWQALYADLTSEPKLFLTDAGVIVAEAKHDEIRIRVRGLRADDLHEDITADKFFTPAGKQAAMVQQDKQRFLKHGNNIAQIEKDLKAGKFLTPEGISQANLMVTFTNN